jgi:hypothetical protein
MGKDSALYQLMDGGFDTVLYISESYRKDFSSIDTEKFTASNVAQNLHQLSIMLK